MVRKNDIVRKRHKLRDVIRLLIVFTFDVDRHRRRFVFDEILKLPPEILERHMDGGCELRELVWIIEVVPPKADHVAARDGITD